MQKISVIVPVYNAEKYINRCLDSIIKQTYKNIEIIIINDGSTDASKTIINKYSDMLPQLIKVFETENKGVASARNLGIEKVTGDYFLFVDADDYIELNLLENLSKIIETEEVDIIKYKMNLIKNDVKILFDGPIFDKVNGEEAFNRLCFTDKMIDTPCLYLFNTKFFKEHDFYFLNNTYHEDFGLIPLVIINAKSFISSNLQGYNYVQVESSIIRENNYEKTLKKANDLFIHYDNMVKSINNMELNNKTKQNVLIYYTNSILLRANELKKEDKRKYKIEIKNRKIINNLKNGTIRGYIKFLYYKLKI